MAGTQQEYTYVANALVAFAYQWIAKLPPFERDLIPTDKIPAAAGATAKLAVDKLDEYRAAHAAPAPTATVIHPDGSSSTS